VLSKSSSSIVVPRRLFFGGSFGKNNKAANESGQGKVSNPVLDQYLKNRPAPVMPERGKLTSDSIFESDRIEREQTDEKVEKHKMDPIARARVLDPDPRARRRWERKMVIRSVRKGWRLTKAQQIKRTERESISKSPLLKTSVKKLGALARQIVGKPIEDAILQMRFSKKLVAQQVRTHLEHAKNEAIVRRGMGLGQVNGTAGDPRDIELKDGKRHKVADSTGIYVDQAWVGRGPFGRGYDFRARGKINVLMLPYTSK